jgi:hypothetical protein
MNSSILAKLCLLIAPLLPASASHAQTASAIQEGQALAAELRTAKPPENIDVQGRIRVRSQDGRRSTAPFRHHVVTGEDHWQLLYETAPSGSEPGQQLTVTLSRHHPPRYTLHGRLDDTGREVGALHLEGDQAMIPFAHSDFWLADLGLDFLHWPAQRIDRNTKLTMRKGRSCKVLESINDRPGAAGYTRVRSWVDIATGGIIIAEAYGPDNRILKEFEIGGFTKIDGRWELKNMEMRHLPNNSRTILEFKYEN